MIFLVEKDILGERWDSTAPSHTQLAPCIKI